ncbi:MAG: heat shock protein DnaJ-like protein [Massilia sp.]|nr:heat shock protein DnaJ-like protein [Massilia sp.]
MHKLLLLLLVTSIHGVSAAQSAGSVGYPTVAAALEALKAKKDVTISIQGGWTIVDDAPAHTIWSFSPLGHPAHPAVVKRTIVENGGMVGMDMTALCQADKVSCDNLMEEFKALNARMSEAMAVRGAATAAAATETAWKPSAAELQSVERHSQAYFAARDSHQYEAAYKMLTPAMRQIRSYESWRSMAVESQTRRGNLLRRDIKKVTWYKNPPGAEPGTYAAVDFAGQSTNADTVCGYLVWIEQADGTFLLVREEENFIDKASDKKLTPEDRERIRAQFKCKA